MWSWLWTGIKKWGAGFSNLPAKAFCLILLLDLMLPRARAFGQVNAASVSAANVTPNPNTTGTASAYTIAFNLGRLGHLDADDAITIIFNEATHVSEGHLNNVQVNGVDAQAIAASSTWTVLISVPSTLRLDHDAAVTITLPFAAIVNPAVAGNYTLTVATSVEATPIISNVYAIVVPPLTGVANPISGSAGGYNKPHQNRSFYYAGVWWTAAKKFSDDKWYLWKLYGDAWSAELEIDSRGGTRPDCFLDAAANKLYILLASPSTTPTQFLRLSYSDNAWNIDPGFPVELSNFVFSGESGNVLTKAKNGELWVFRYRVTNIEGKRSSDDGLTWSPAFIVKGGLFASGLCDAVVFTSGGENFVGVGYAENTSGNGKFGFLMHRDGDADESWTDETNVMPQFSGANSDNHIALAGSLNNEIFFVCKTRPTARGAVSIGLLKRKSNGDWKSFAVQTGGGWTRPTVAIDETNNALYVFGTRENAPDHGQYKKCAIGSENTLHDAAAMEIFSGGAFNNVSVPAHYVTGATDLLVCAENTSNNEIWYSLLPVDGSGVFAKSTAALSPVSVYPNPFSSNAAVVNTATTIRFTLNASGPVTLQIFNLRGELVTTLVDRAFIAGLHEQRWNGRDDYGLTVASGMYFYRLRIGAEIFRGRLQMVK
jgi:hypothetical protein